MPRETDLQNSYKIPSSKYNRFCHHLQIHYNIQSLHTNIDMNSQILQQVVRKVSDSEQSSSKIKQIPNFIKTKATKLKRNAKNVTNTIKNWFKRYVKHIVIAATVLSAIIITLACVLSSLKGVGIDKQAVLINHAESRIVQEQFENQQVYLGLSSSLYVVPKCNFLISFDSHGTETEFKSDSINARTQQGTKITVSAKVQTKIITQQLWNFLQEYGLNWHIYPIQKTKNVIIQIIAATKFYDLNNAELTTKINKQFAENTNINDKFSFSILSLKINYMANSFAASNSGGVDLLIKKSVETQLSRHYANLTTKISSQQSTLDSYVTEIGRIEGENKRVEIELAALRKNWLQGTLTCKGMLNNNSEEMRRFIWYYFQNFYNQTYISNNPKSQ